jgi:D-serine deaminase-like pyridoxal phosphate-dependent protein
VTQRLDLAHGWFAGRDIQEIVLVAQGDSGGPALAGLAEAGARRFRAIVLISSPQDPDDLAAFARLAVPVLDVVAEFDTQSAEVGQARRSDRARDSGQAYRHLTIPAAGPGYRATAALLVARVRAWLARTVDPG